MLGMTLGEIITVLIIGGIAGWIASILMGSKGGLLRNIIIGVIGGIIGPIILNAVGINLSGTVSTEMQTTEERIKAFEELVK